MIVERRWCAPRGLAIFGCEYSTITGASFVRTVIGSLYETLICACRRSSFTVNHTFTNPGPASSDRSTKGSIPIAVQITCAISRGDFPIFVARRSAIDVETSPCSTLPETSHSTEISVIEYVSASTRVVHCDNSSNIRGQRIPFKPYSRYTLFRAHTSSPCHHSVRCTL